MIFEPDQPAEVTKTLPNATVFLSINSVNRVKYRGVLGHEYQQRPD